MRLGKYKGIMFLLAFGLLLLIPISLKADTNYPPVFKSDPLNAVIAGQAYTYNSKATDQDSDTLVYTITSAPEGMTINQTTGLINWLPTVAGQYNVVIQVSDQKNGYDVQAFQITVEPATVNSIIITPNDRPTLVALGQKKQFSARSFDKYSNEVFDAKLIWTTELKIGTIDQTGLFTATQGGVGFAAAEINNAKTSVGVIVKGAITSITTETPSPPAPTETKPTQTAKPKVLGVATQETTNTNTVTVSPEKKEEATTQPASVCKNWRNWIIVMILIIYGIILLVYYLFIKRYRVKRVRGWWIIPLFLTALGEIGYFKYFCKNTYLWWPWVFLAIGVVLTVYYWWTSRKKIDYTQSELPF